MSWYLVGSAEGEGGDTTTTPYGPLSTDAVAKLQSSGYVVPSSLIWAAHLGDKWMPVGDIPELAQQTAAHPSAAETAVAERQLAQTADRDAMWSECERLQEQVAHLQLRLEGRPGAPGGPALFRAPRCLPPIRGGAVPSAAISGAAAAYGPGSAGPIVPPQPPTAPPARP